MKSASYNGNASQPMHCNYNNLYEPIYDSVYGVNFVFYDEEEMTDYDNEPGFISELSISGQLCQTAASKKSTSNHHH